MSVARTLARRHVGHPAQDDVADVVAVGVIDPLEQVDVDEPDRERTVVAACPLDLAEEHAQQRGTVGDPGQAVGGRGIVRGGERRTELGDSPREAVIEARAVGRDGRREIARCETLGSRDNRDHPAPNPDARGNRRRARAEERGHREGSRLHAGKICVAARADERDEGQEGDRSEKPQPAEGTYHAATVPAPAGEIALPEGTAGPTGSPEPAPGLDPLRRLRAWGPRPVGSASSRGRTVAPPAADILRGSRRRGPPSPSKERAIVRGRHPGQAMNREGACPTGSRARITERAGQASEQVPVARAEGGSCRPASTSAPGGR